MIEAIAILAGAVVFMFVSFCATWVGHNRLAKVGVLIMLLGLAAGLVVNRLLTNALEGLWAGGDGGRALSRAKWLLILGEAAFWTAGAGGVLVFVGSAIRTWQERRTIFTFRGKREAGRDPSDRA